jgi:hypothetical protein
MRLRPKSLHNPLNNLLEQSEILAEREGQLKDMRTMNYRLLWWRERSFF